jgi:hypothetical protein
MALSIVYSVLSSAMRTEERGYKAAKIEKSRAAAVEQIQSLFRPASSNYDPSDSVNKFMENLPLGESREDTLPDAQIASPIPLSPLKLSILSDKEETSALHLSAKGRLK